LFKKLGTINQAPTKNGGFLPLFNTFLKLKGVVVGVVVRMVVQVRPLSITMPKK